MRAEPAGALPVLEARGLVRHHGAVRALDGVDLAVRAGERVAVVGRSGSGKSTLARCLARLEEPTAGTVLVDGVDVTGRRGQALLPVRRAVQLVFQDAATSLNPRWTVADCVAEPARLLDAAPLGAAHERAMAALAAVGLPATLAARRPGELSGGQRQRAALARALLASPRALLLDEVTSGLDAAIQAEVVALLLRLHAASGAALVFVTHDLRLARRVAARVVVVAAGRVVEDGAADEVLEDPRHEATRALVGAAFGAP